ncbi:hypothetical protein [Stenotrophomonas sp. CFBP8980]|nr:hypothetical protein [Stenotrophomonas sp. CFBP8980]MDY1032048.1 hypothetical protein [Stenotrophomonas sp. CFBP8980]
MSHEKLPGPWRAAWHRMGRWRWLWLVLLLVWASLVPLEAMK